MTAVISPLQGHWCGCSRTPQGVRSGGVTITTGQQPTSRQGQADLTGRCGRVQVGAGVFRSVRSWVSAVLKPPDQNQFPEWAPRSQTSLLWTA
jgi:hypothetical protein